MSCHGEISLPDESMKDMRKSSVPGCPEAVEVNMSSLLFLLSLLESMRIAGPAREKAMGIRCCRNPAQARPIVTAASPDNLLADMTITALR